MRHPRWFLLAALLVLLPARSWAVDVFSVSVCNDGPIVVEVAAAVKYQGEWEIKGWTKVARGDCQEVHSGFYERSTYWGKSEAYLAFAFTDAIGVWGTRPLSFRNGRWNGDVEPEARAVAAPSDLRICVARPNFRYRRKGGDPAAECAGNSAAFLIPTSQNLVELTNWDPDIKAINVHVAFGPRDRAIPLGSRASTDPAPAAPSSQSPPAPSPSLCGAVSCGDRILKGMADEAARLAAERAAAAQPPAPPARPPAPSANPAPEPPANAAARPDISVTLCVPPDLMERQSWRTPAPDSKMAIFKSVVRDYVWTFGTEKVKYVIRDKAFENFDPKDRFSGTLLDEVSAAQPCPPSHYRSTLQVPAGN